MRKIFTSILLTAAALVSRGEDQNCPVIQAVRTSSLPFSAEMTAPAWKNAPAYAFYKTAGTLEDFYRLPKEKAVVKLLYDDNYLYVGVRLQDSEVVSSGKSNQTFLFALGDTVEVFLKPAGEKYYWEIYGTPGKLTSCFYFRSRGVAGLSECYQYPLPAIKVDAVIDGTFNNWRDRDKGWKLLIAIPLKELRKHGLKFTTEENWTILVARYNYSRFLEETELSGFPQIIPDFHPLKNYARLELVTTTK